MARKLRIECEQRTRAGGTLTDLRTGKQPFFYRGEAVTLELGLFANGRMLTKTDLTWIKVRWRNGATLLSETLIPSSAMSEALTAQQWRQGIASLATVSFSAFSTGNFPAGMLTLEIVGRESGGESVFASGTVESATAPSFTTGTPPTPAPPIAYTQEETDALIEGATAAGEAALAAANDVAATVDLKANKDGSNLDNASVHYAALNPDVTSLLTGGQTFPLSTRLGIVDALSDNLAAAGANSGKWYFVEGVSGMMVGTNPPAAAVMDGGYIYSDGTAWLVHRPPPVTLPDGIVERPKLSPDNQSAVAFVDDVVRGTVADVRASLSDYTGDDPVRPVIHGPDGEKYLSIDTQSGRWVSGLAGWGSSGGGAVPAEGQPGGLLAAANRITFTRSRSQIIFTGQSLSDGYGTGAVLTSAQAYANRTFDVGPKASYGADAGTNDGMTADKLLVEDTASSYSGTNKETPCSGFAETASLRMYMEQGVPPASRVLFLSCGGHSGYSIADLETGQPWYQVTKNHIVRAAAILGGANVALHAITHIQGENEASVAAGMSGATWKTKTAQYRTDLQVDAVTASGQTTPVHMLLFQTANYIQDDGIYDGRPDIALAQLELCAENPLIHFVGAMYHIPRADTVHPTAIGAKWMGAYAGRAYSEIAAGRRPNWLRPLAAVRRGTEITVTFDGPYPITLDRAGLALATNDGFKVMDAGGDCAIESISVTGERKLRIILADTPSGSVTVRYALDYLGTGLTILGGASGNLRDTCPDTVRISGSDYPLFNVCPHFLLSVQTIP